MAVGAHASGDDELFEMLGLQRAGDLGDEGVDYRILEAEGNISLCLISEPVTGLLHRSRCRGLETGEAEVISGAVGHRAGEHIFPAVSPLRQGRHAGAARVGDAEELCGLVERLARRVVYRLPHYFVRSGARDLHDHGVAAGDKEREERIVRLLLLEHRRKEVSLHVMDGHRRAAPGEGKGSADCGTDKKRADEPGARSVGDRVDVLRSEPG